jgi:hypothetical protein
MLSGRCLEVEREGKRGQDEHGGRQRGLPLKPLHQLPGQMSEADPGPHPQTMKLAMKK